MFGSWGIPYNNKIVSLLSEIILMGGRFFHVTNLEVLTVFNGLYRSWWRI